MIIDRRTFIQISVPLVATAAAVTFLPSGIAGASSSQLAGGKQDQKHPTFKIHGWDRRDDSAGDSSDDIVGWLNDRRPEQRRNFHQHQSILAYRLAMTCHPPGRVNERTLQAADLELAEHG